MVIIFKMKLNLRNILKIESADIELGGLTVITGENDSGKSSIGKVLFSILKAVNGYKEVDSERIFHMIRISVMNIWKMFPDNHSKWGLRHLHSVSRSLLEADRFYEFSKEVMKEATEHDFETRRYAILEHRLSELNRIISEYKKPELAVKRTFEHIANGEFKENLNSYGTTESHICFYDDTIDAKGSEIIINFENGQLLQMQVKGQISIEDITYIESPVYLHILDALRGSLRESYFFHRANVPYHLSDMAEKLLRSSNEKYGSLEQLNDYQSQLDNISSLINGDFILDEDSDQLFFQKGEQTIPTVSVASGIKSFGMLMRLIKSGSISTSKILVLDEPEIHLHPEWQVEYCKLIVELVSQGVPIVVSSHSPYFIQGLRYFSAARGIEKDVTYYLAEQNEYNELSTLKDVTYDLNKVFTLLAAPLQEIMNVDAVRKERR